MGVKDAEVKEQGLQRRLEEWRDVGKGILL